MKVVVLFNPQQMTKIHAVLPMRFGSHPVHSQSHIPLFLRTYALLRCSVVDFEGPRVCVIQLRLRGSMLVIISAYIRHSSRDGAHQLSRAITRASEMLPFVFVGMDCNGRLLVWDPATSTVDRVGESVEAMLCEGRVLVLNSQDSRLHSVAMQCTYHG